MVSLHKKFIVNFIWQIIGQFGYLSITLVGNIILARLLGTYEFGILGILLFFIALSKVLTESGLSGALVRKKNPTDEDYSTIFVFNLIISVICYTLLFFLSPFIASFYKNLELVLYLRIIGLVLIINAFQFTQYTRLVVNLKYRLISNYSIVANFFSTSIGIILAFLGFGIWSLITMQLLNVTILTSIYWFREGGYSKIIFRKKVFLEMYQFGMYTTLSSLLNTIFENSYQLIISKYFSVNMAGDFFQGKKLQEIPIGILNKAASGVVYSTLSKSNDDKETFQKIYSKIAIIFTSIVGLICLNLYLFAKDFILILYGTKWLNAVFYIKVLSIGSFFYMQEMLNRNIFKVFDRTDRILFLEFIKKLIQSVSIIIGIILLDIEVLMYGFIITSFISFFINYIESRKVFVNDNGIFKELSVTIKIFFLLLSLSFSFDYLFNFLEINIYLKVIILIPIISLFYLIVLNFFNILKFSELLLIIKKIKNA